MALRQRSNVAILAGRASYQLGQFALIVAPSFWLADGDYERLVVMYTTTSILVLSALIALHASILRVDHGVFARAHPSLACFLLGVPLTLVATAVTVGFGARSGDEMLATLGFGIAAVLNGDVLLRSSLAARDGRPLTAGALELWAGVAVVAAVAVLALFKSDQPITWSIGYLVASTVAALAAWAVRSGSGRARTSAAEIGSAAWAILSDGKLLLVTGLLMSAFNRVDFLLLSVLASDEESTRYALATRFAGPALVGLSALNNSMFIRQLERKRDLPALSAYTRSVVPRLVKLTVGVCAVALLAAVALTQTVDNFGSRQLVLPSAILLLATCIFAASVPWAFALNTIGHERHWMAILAVTLLIDAGLVATVGHRDAVACALSWLATQMVVFVAVRRAARRVGLDTKSMPA
jgi:O-antigen/teichoic acid export membrane protein